MNVHLKVDATYRIARTKETVNCDGESQLAIRNSQMMRRCSNRTPVSGPVPCFNTTSFVASGGPL